jgi:hypothetical protein
MTPNDTETRTVTLSGRDVQWLTALVALSTTVLNPNATRAALENNVDTLCELFDSHHYSGAEINALYDMLYNALPITSPIGDFRLRAFSTSLVS